jgi:hypothetical protein
VLTSLSIRNCDKLTVTVRHDGGYCWLEGTTSASLLQTRRSAPRASLLLVRDGGPGGDSLPSSEAFRARNSREPASSCGCELPRGYFGADFGVSVTRGVAAEEGASRVSQKLTIGRSCSGSNWASACVEDNGLPSRGTGRAFARQLGPQEASCRRRRRSAPSSTPLSRPRLVASTHASRRARCRCTGDQEEVAAEVSKALTSPDDSVGPAAELTLETPG